MPPPPLNVNGEAGPSSSSSRGVKRTSRTPDVQSNQPSDAKRPRIGPRKKRSGHFRKRSLKALKGKGKEIPIDAERFELSDDDPPIDDLAVFAINRSDSLTLSSTSTASLRDSSGVEIERLRKELDAKNEIIQKQESTLQNLQNVLQCQICLEMLWKPFILSPCGHVLCESCLKSWFTSPPPGEPDFPPLLAPEMRKKTCPCCRTEVKIRPVAIYLVKSAVNTILPSLDPSTYSKPLIEDESTEEDIWKGVFPAVANGRGVEDHPNVVFDEEDGGVPRCIECLHEIFDGLCTGCGRVYPYVSDDEEDWLDQAHSVYGGSGGEGDSDDSQYEGSFIDDGGARNPRRNPRHPIFQHDFLAQIFRRHDDEDDEEEFHDADSGDEDRSGRLLSDAQEDSDQFHDALTGSEAEDSRVASRRSREVPVYAVSNNGLDDEEQDHPPRASGSGARRPVTYITSDEESDPPVPMSNQRSRRHRRLRESNISSIISSDEDVSVHEVRPAVRRFHTVNIMSSPESGNDSDEPRYRGRAAQIAREELERYGEDDFVPSHHRGRGRRLTIAVGSEDGYESSSIDGGSLARSETSEQYVSASDEDERLDANDDEAGVRYNTDSESDLD